MADAVSPRLPDGDAEELARAVSRAREIAPDPFADAAALREAAGPMRAQLSALARAGLDVGARRAVLAHSAELLTLLRAYYGPVGWDPDVAELPSLPEIFDARRIS